MKQTKFAYCHGVNENMGMYTSLWYLFSQIFRVLKYKYLEYSSWGLLCCDAS